jgi:hypothetical protein
MVVNRVAEWVRHGYTTTLSHLRREVLDQRALPASKVFPGDGSSPCYSLTQRPATSEQAPVAGRWSPLVTRAQSRDFLCPCTLAASAASAATRSQRRRVMSVCAGSVGFL